MILNTGKCHKMCMGKDVDENETSQISSQQKIIVKKEILGIKIDRKLSFNKVSSSSRTSLYVEMHLMDKYLCCQANV